MYVLLAFLCFTTRRHSEGGFISFLIFFVFRSVRHMSFYVITLEFHMHQHHCVFLMQHVCVCVCVSGRVSTFLQSQHPLPQVFLVYSTIQ